MRIALVIRGALLCAAWHAAATAAIAQPDANTSQGAASAQIVEPIGVVAVSDLEFGAIAVSAYEGGEVTIAPASGDRKSVV